MSIYLIVFGAFAVFILFMALGIIFGRAALKGSCGGVGKKLLGIKCESCQGSGEDLGQDHCRKG